MTLYALDSPPNGPFRSPTPGESMSRPHRPDKAFADATRQIFAAILMLVATVAIPIFAGQLYGWVTVAAVITGLGALIAAYAAGINTQRWNHP